METRVSDRGYGVILADSQACVREALALWLASLPEVAWVAEARDADDALRLALARCPRLVLLDVDLPGRSAFDAGETIGQRCPDTRLVFVTGACGDRDIESAQRSGAAGIVARSESLDTLRAALRAVAGGGTYHSPEIAARLVLSGGAAAGASKRRTTRRSLLTPREVDVLRHLAQGCSKKHIAELTHLSERTVNRHCANLMAKLDIHDRVALARYAFREGLCEP